MQSLMRLIDELQRTLTIKLTSKKRNTKKLFVSVLCGSPVRVAIDSPKMSDN